MTKARRLGVYTPVLYAVDTVLHTLTFEYVEGPSVKDVFLEFGLGGGGVAAERMDDIAMQIGQAIGKLHDGGLIHGDLTTSNLLIRAATNQVVGYLLNSSFVHQRYALVALHIGITLTSFFSRLLLILV